MPTDEVPAPRWFNVALLMVASFGAESVQGGREGPVEGGVGALFDGDDLPPLKFSPL